jgi:hypothetical protein
VSRKSKTARLKGQETEPPSPPETNVTHLAQTEHSDLQSKRGRVTTNGTRDFDRRAHRAFRSIDQIHYWKAAYSSLGVQYAHALTEMGW